MKQPLTNLICIRGQALPMGKQGTRKEGIGGFTPKLHLRHAVECDERKGMLPFLVPDPADLNTLRPAQSATLFLAVLTARGPKTPAEERSCLFNCYKVWCVTGAN